MSYADYVANQDYVVDQQASVPPITESEKLIAMDGPAAAKKLLGLGGEDLAEMLGLSAFVRTEGVIR